MNDRQQVLSSWKEIAEFLGKGVRTAQRWERELGLPVRRPPGSRQGVVIAFPDELRAWAAGEQNGVLAGDSELRRRRVVSTAHIAAMAESARSLAQSLERVRAESTKLRRSAAMFCMRAQELRSAPASEKSSWIDRALP